MIDVDLENFAVTGLLGAFDSTSTRTQIENLLGAPDTGGYPDHASYGHVAFDLAGGNGPPCRIQVLFPHSSHMRPANPNWINWTAPTCFDEWTDRRFKWNLGRFVPELSIDDAIQMLDDFTESEMILSTNGMRILHNAKSGVDLMFERDSKFGMVTLTNMIAHPQIIAG